MAHTVSNYVQITRLYIYMVPCPVFPPPPWDGGGYDAPVVVYIHTYLHTYLPTYLHTYVHTYIHTLTLHYLTLPYITLPYIPYIHTYQHTNIPPPQATGGGTRRTIPPPQATGGGTRRTIPPPQATGGGPEEPDDTVHPYPVVGGEGGWPTLHHIYYINQKKDGYGSIMFNRFYRC